MRASIPRVVDDLVSRSVIGASKSRGVTRIQDSLGFANAIASAKDYFTPMSTTTVRAPAGISQSASPVSVAKRVIGVVVAAALVLATALVGIQLLNSSPSSISQLDSSGNVVDSLEILTSPATPFIEVDVGNIAEVVPIASARSFDPRGAAPNGALGKEKEKGAPLAIDGDAVTAWTTKAYKTSTLGKKGGLGSSWTSAKRQM